MTSNAQESEWSEETGHSDSGVPDWLAGDDWAAFTDAHPEWYNPDQLALLDSDQRQWWQDRLDVRDLAPLPTTPHPQADTPAGDHGTEHDQSMVDTDLVTAENPAAASETEPTADTDHEETQEDDPEGSGPLAALEADFAETTVTGEDDHDPGLDTEDVDAVAHLDAETSVLAESTEPLLDPGEPIDTPAELLSEPSESDPQEDTANKGRLSFAALWGRLTAATKRGDTDEQPKNDEELDPYRPRFAVAPTWTRTASILLWVTSGVCIMAAAVAVAASLSGGSVLSVPAPVLLLAALLLGGAAIACILAGQGIARGYRTWFVAAVVLALVTVWSPLTSLPLLLALSQRDTRDWVI